MTLVVMCEKDIDIPASSFLSINTLFILNHAALSIPYGFLFVCSLRGANQKKQSSHFKFKQFNSKSSHTLITSHKSDSALVFCKCI